MTLKFRTLSLAKTWYGVSSQRAGSALIYGAHVVVGIAYTIDPVYASEVRDYLGIYPLSFVFPFMLTSRESCFVEDYREKVWHHVVFFLHNRMPLNVV